MALMRFIYKPFGITIALLAGLLSKKLFDQIWGLIDEEEPPKPTTHETSWPKVIGAALVQGMTFKVTRAVVDRGAATGYHRLTGVWPGEERPDIE